MPAVSEEEGRARVVGMWHLFALLNATLVPGTRASLHGRQAFDRPSGKASRVGRDSSRRGCPEGSNLRTPGSGLGVHTVIQTLSSENMARWQEKRSVLTGVWSQRWEKGPG